LKSNRKPYVNTETFLDHIEIVFFPNLIELRTLDEFAEEFAVLLMDNCSSHVTGYAIALLTKARVRVITLAPHTTKIFQILDVTLLKRHLRYELPFEDQKATVKSIMKVYHDFKPTILEPNIWRTFQALGFEFDTKTELYRLLFNEEKLGESADFWGL
jgi:phosphopantothenoylcysteine synthetase/decarboxylase